MKSVVGAIATAVGYVVRLVAILLGPGLMTYGIYQIYRPGAYIFAGVVATALTWFPRKGGK